MTPDIYDSLTKLRLFHTAENIDLLIKTAVKNKLSPAEIIELFVKNETEDRQCRQLQTRLRNAKIGRFDPMVDFDWNWPKTIPRKVVESLLDLHFIDELTNAIFVGPAGVGKTMIAKNIAQAAAEKGHTVLFVEAGDMLSDLGSQESTAALRRRIQRYVKPKLLVIDEVGYLSYSEGAADLLFQVVNHRYEQVPTVITTNKAFKDWGDMFPNAGCVSAMLDRLTHHAEIIAINGESWRRKEAKENKGKKSARTSKIKGKK